MSIFLNKDSKVIVQGITGGEGTKHTALMLKAGTQVVGGVNARKAGTTVSHTAADGSTVELPVFANTQDMAELARIVDARLGRRDRLFGYLIEGHGIYAWGVDLADAQRQFDRYRGFYQGDAVTVKPHFAREGDSISAREGEAV